MRAAQVGKFTYRLPETCPPTSTSMEFSEALIGQCLDLYFQWQNPHCMFIDREVFMRDYLHAPLSEKWKMEPLVYASCSLGALMSLESEIKQMADVFSKSAEDIILGSLFHPDVLLIQALLCCAYYESGRDHPSKAWALSGTGFDLLGPEIS